MRAFADHDRRKVTLVDDEPHALNVMMRAARSWNFDCQGARSAEEAVVLLERNPTPVVVTDLRMPGRGGAWLVEEIGRRWPEISVIVITGVQEDEAVESALEEGANHFFLKPFQLDEFRHALRHSLRRFHRRIERSKVHQELTRERDQHRERRKDTFRNAVACLFRTLEARDPATASHSLRVRAFALRLGVRLGLDSRTMKQLALASKFHDIGKIGVPDDILYKASSLTREELDNVRDHPVVGERILATIVRSPDVLAAVRHHHERYDGQGYPDRLPGESIPLLARIVTIADFFDALTSERVYRESLPIESVLEKLLEGASRQFDPRLTPIFVDLIRFGK
ncbi:MAG: response regulator [Gemmataceae bacterium]|nr:response regulator [Gemmataceae bacterium]